MKCKFCGWEVPEGEKKCPACGAAVEADNAEAKETGQAQPGYGEYGQQGQKDQYGITSQGFSAQDQQGQYQYGTSGQDQQGQYQYGTSGQDQQNQYQNGSWDQNQQGQYQYGAPDQSGYSYGKAEGGNYGQPVKPLSGTPYMIFAIITTLFCCLPLGIAAIVFASKIGPLQKAGDYAGAQEEAQKAKLATIIGMVVGGIVTLVYIGMLMTGLKKYTSSVIENYPAMEEIEEFHSDIEPFDPADLEEEEDEEEPEEKEEPEEEKAPLQLAEPASGLGATWDTFTVQINDKVLALPCTMAELEAAGLSLDTEDTPENYVVNAREYVYTYFKDANGNEVLIDIVNLTEEPKSLGECIIGGISVYDYEVENGGMKVIFPGGVQIGTPKAEVLEKYGESEDSYEEDEDESAYTWYADNAYYSYCEIDIDSETGLVCSMFMENYGE